MSRKRPQILDEQLGYDAIALRVAAADMGEDGDALGGPERVLDGQWLLAEYVEDRAGDLLALDRGDQVGVGNQVASAEVQQPGGGLHPGEAPGVDEVLGVGRGGQQQQDVVGLRQDLVGPLGRQDRVEVGQFLRGAALGADDAHADGRCDVRHLLADGAEAEDAERLAGERGGDAADPLAVLLVLTMAA